MPFLARFNRKLVYILFLIYDFCLHFLCICVYIFLYFVAERSCSFWIFIFFYMLDSMFMKLIDTASVGEVNKRKDLEA